MNWKRISARGVSELSALARKSPDTQPGLRILLYHAVGSRLECDPYGINIDPPLFEKQIEILAALGVTTALSGAENGINSHAMRIAVTFDDGYRDNLYTVAPILLKHHLPFTVFVTSSFIESGAGPYLTPAELIELAALPGVTIGSHGATHSRLVDCDDATLWNELHLSRRYLEDLIGAPVTMISYPHGSVNLRVRDAAERAGYVIGATSRFGINTVDEDPLRLNRVEIVAQDTERVFSQKLNGHWDWRGHLP